jgi:hypothetical protein
LRDGAWRRMEVLLLNRVDGKGLIQPLKDLLCNAGDGESERC